MAQVSYGTITITDIPSSGSTNQHFWFNPTQQGTLLAGAYITDIDIDTFKSNKAGGYVLARSNGIEFGKGVYKSVELIAGTQNDALNFYEPNSNIIDASLTSKGLILSKGGIEAGTKNSSDYIYVTSSDDVTDHTLAINNSGNKSDWRIVAGNSFGVDKAGNLYASSANISGVLTVQSGSNVYTKTESDNKYEAEGEVAKYITYISAEGGIKVHNANDLLNYVKINSDGLEVYKNDISIANFGTTARIGAGSSSRFLINADSLEAYDGNNDKYFEISANGLSWGDNTAATTVQVTNAATTATSYITYINATDGIKVHNSNDSSNYLQLNSTAISLIKGGTERMKLDANNLRLGDTTNYANINSDGLKVYKSSLVASFGSTSQVGPDDSYHIIINGNGMQFLPATGGQGGGEFVTTSQGIGIRVSGTNKPVYPNTLGSLGLQNWTTSLNCYDYENNMSVVIDETQNSNKASLSLSVSASATVASIDLKIDKSKAWNAFDRGTITIGDGSYGRQIHMATDVNIGGQNSNYDDGTGVFGNSYLYFSSARATKSTSSSYNAAYFFSDTTRSNNGLPSSYLGTLINSSSKRYKHNVNLLKDQTIDAHNLYNAEVVQFFYNDEYIDKKDCRYGIPLPGFIAEDLYEIYPVAVDINENGEPETWNERYIIPPMLKLIQEQHQEIQELMSEIIELKRRIK